MVKTPVTYNSTIFTINDADADLLIDLEVTIPRASDIVCGEYTDEVVTKMNSIGNQIANALNTATDQSRVIEELTAERDTLRREVEAVKARSGQPYWWCPKCKIEVDGKQVTYWERHEMCGGEVEIKTEPYTEAK